MCVIDVHRNKFFLILVAGLIALGLSLTACSGGETSPTPPPPKPTDQPEKQTIPSPIPKPSPTPTPKDTEDGGSKDQKMELVLMSQAFQEGEEIPTKYSCDGQDISPQLSWTGVPDGTQSFALIVDDPDAPVGVWNHWVLFNLPPDTVELPEAMPTQGQLPSGALQGKTNFGTTGYGGPCPPPGPAHRYQFTLYALDQMLDLKAGASKKQVLEAMEGHILSETTLTGMYER